MRTIIYFSILLGLVSCSGNFKSQNNSGNQSFSYTGESLKAIAFPVGGIGTGNITIGGRGNIYEMEIFNRPAKNRSADAFFIIRTKENGKEAVTKVAERKYLQPYIDAPFGSLPGLSRFDEVIFQGKYPFANVQLQDRAIPVKIEMEAYNPFIPLDVDNSSIPAATLNWKITNPTSSDVDVTLAFNVKNPIISQEMNRSENNKNEFIDNSDIRGIMFSSAGANKDSVDFGNVFFGTSEKDVDIQTHWPDGSYWDAYHIITDDISDDGRIQNVRETYEKLAGTNDYTQFATVSVHLKLKAKEERTIPFYYTWYFPNRKSIPIGGQGLKIFTFKNYYATKFTDSKDVVAYFIKHKDYLYNETRKFSDVVYNSSYPSYVKDAIMSQASSLKTNLVLRDEKGNFYGYEGLRDNEGGDAGSCTHVWNYEQALAFLFPSLERTMREVAFLDDTKDNGYQPFRTLFPPHDELWQYFPAADGQMGNIVRVYREWKLSGDNEWLRKMWPKVKQTLEFAWKGVGNVPAKYAWQKERQPIAWDADKDGVMEGVMHNTYDIEFYGPNTMTTSVYLAALKGCSEMARAMGDSEKSNEYLNIYKSGVKYCDNKLWNGSYYIQEVSVHKGIVVPANLKGNKDSLPKYQYGAGCLSDQLLGQFLANVSGIGYILDKEHIKLAMKSIFDNNFKKSFANFNNVQRVYALNDEAGLVLCTWPKGGRPALPFIYCDEVWTGIEYQVAASLIYSGYINEGLEMVKAVRARYAGFNRNPWDELEAGHHYARAMASWAVMLALSGYQYDGVNHSLCFDPKININDFNTFWSCGSGWGKFSLKGKNITLSVDFGTLTLTELGIGSNYGFKSTKSILLNNTELKGKISNGEDYCKVVFDQKLQINKGDSIKITFGN